MEVKSYNRGDPGQLLALFLGHNHKTLLSSPVKALGMKVSSSEMSCWSSEQTSTHCSIWSVASILGGGVKSGCNVAHALFFCKNLLTCPKTIYHHFTSSWMVRCWWLWMNCWICNILRSCAGQRSPCVDVVINWLLHLPWIPHAT